MSLPEGYLITQSRRFFAFSRIYALRGKQGFYAKAHKNMSFHASTHFIFHFHEFTQKFWAFHAFMQQKTLFREVISGYFRGTKWTQNVAFPTISSSSNFHKLSLFYFQICWLIGKKVYGLECKMVFLSVGMLVCVRVWKKIQTLPSPPWKQNL